MLGNNIFLFSEKMRYNVPNEVHCVSMKTLYGWGKPFSIKQNTVINGSPIVTYKKGEFEQ